MKLLRFEVKGLDLMKEPIAVDLYARQQVREDDKFLLHHLVSNSYLNTTNAFIGINASGKTTLLRVTNLVLDMLNNRPLNHAIGKEVLANSPTVTVTSYVFIEPNVLFKLETTITTTISQLQFNRMAGCIVLLPMKSCGRKRFPKIRRLSKRLCLSFQTDRYTSVGLNPVTFYQMMSA